MSRHKSIFNKLTKKELVHLIETTGGTMEKFKSMRVMQRVSKKAFPEIEPCWECKHIAKKLGLE